MTGWTEANFETKRVQVLLRGNRLLTGRIHVLAGQSLIAFLQAKRHFLNLTQARWVGGVTSDRVVPHFALRLNQVIWVGLLDGDIPLTSGVEPETSDRMVELHLVDNASLNVMLHIATEQRMSDYFDLNAGFVPLRNAQVTPSGEVHRVLAVNHEAILAIREIEVEEQPAGFQSKLR